MITSPMYARVTAFVLSVLLGTTALAQESPVPRSVWFRLRTDGRAIEVMSSTLPDAILLSTVGLYVPASDMQRINDFVFLINQGTGVTVMDLRDLNAPGRYVIEPGTPVIGLVRSGERTLLLKLPRGELAAYDVTDPAHVVLRSRTGARQAANGDVPGPRSTPPESNEAPLYRRAFARFSLAQPIIPGVISDFGGDRSPDGGLWVNGALTIANTELASWIPAFRAHLTLGFSGQHFAIGGDLGGGAGLALSLGSLDLGFALRFGRVDGAHLRLLLYWWAFPPSPIPIGGELALLVPIGSRTWFQMEIRGDYRLGIWGTGILGAQHQVGAHQGGRNFVSWGLGAGFVYPFPSALLQVGYERRY